MARPALKLSPASPRVEIVSVTPELAHEWLGQNTRNRRLKSRCIASYARDMLAGNWRMTGEGIKFSSEGRLLDGQNRLHAVIVADVTVLMMVVFDLPDDAQEVMDGGTRRTNADQLTLHGIQYATNVASIAVVYTSWITKYWANAGSTGSGIAMTHAEVLAFVHKYPNVQDAGLMLNRVRKSLPLSPAAVGAAWMVLADLDVVAATEFFDKIANLETTGAGDPIATLIKRVLSDRGLNRRVHPAEALYMIFRTWNAWRKGQKLTMLKTGSKGNGFPEIPEPK